MITAIFDLDGTLADTLADLADATNYGLRALGYPEHGYDSYRKFVGNGVVKLCERALPEDRKQDTEKLHGLFSEYYNAHYLDKTSLYEGIGDTLKALDRDGVRLAVATNKPQEFAVPIVEALLPGVPFVKVLGGCGERPKKPDTAIIDEILQALPESSAVYMIGDSDVDILTGHNAGITSIGCVWGFRGRQELESAGADFIAEKAQDIYEIITGRHDI